MGLKRILFSPDEVPGGSQATSDGGEQKAPEDSDKKNPEETGKPSESPVVTANVLKQIMAQLQKDVSKEIGSLVGDLSTKIEHQAKELETLRDGTKPASDSGKGGTERVAKDDAELVTLRKNLADYEKKLQTTQKEIESARQRERESSFKHQVMEALSKAKCMKPDIAFPHIQNTLERDGERIFKTVDSEFGRREYELDEYIKDVYSEQIAPELFHGKVRAGSAASGDHGDSNGKWLFTKEQIADPEYYKENRSAIQKALEQNRVKGISVPADRK